MSEFLIIAAGLFDSPWAVAIFVLAGAIINWLSQRRANKAGKNEDAETGDSMSEPPAKVSWEERLRRMLEESPQQSPAPSAPPMPSPPLTRRPPLPRPAVPPVIVPAERQTASALRPTLFESVVSDEFESTDPTVRRYELSSAAHAAQAQHASRRLLQTKAKPPVFKSLRDPQNARQAFAASLVFGPPKGLE